MDLSPNELEVCPKRIFGQNSRNCESEINYSQLGNSEFLLRFVDVRIMVL